VGNQGSGILSSVVQADVLVVVPEAQGDVAEGDTVDVMLLEG
jgi:molybdopterin molybdotransferase